MGSWVAQNRSILAQARLAHRCNHIYKTVSLSLTQLNNARRLTVAQGTRVRQGRVHARGLFAPGPAALESCAFEVCVASRCWGWGTVMWPAGSCCACTSKHHAWTRPQQEALTSPNSPILPQRLHPPHRSVSDIRTSTLTVPTAQGFGKLGGALNVAGTSPASSSAAPAAANGSKAGTAVMEAEAAAVPQVTHCPNLTALRKAMVGGVGRGGVAEGLSVYVLLGEGWERAAA